VRDKNFILLRDIGYLPSKRIERSVSGQYSIAIFHAKLTKTGIVREAEIRTKGIL